MITSNDSNQKKLFDNRPQDIIEAEMKSFQDHILHIERIAEIVSLADTISYDDDLGKYVRNLVNKWREEDNNDWN